MGIGDRTIRRSRSTISAYCRHAKGYPVAPATLADYLKQARIDRGLSQRELGEILGVTDAAVEKWENNQNRPSVLHRPRIVAFIGFDPMISLNKTINTAI